MDVLALLRSKNGCLEKFLQVTREFWDCAAAGDLDGLSAFEQKRDSHLKAIELFDAKIGEAVAQLPDSARNREMVAAVENELARKEKLIHEILAVDLKIIAKIEQVRADLIKDLANSRKSKETLAKFKSTWLSESGEELDQKL